VFKLITIGYRPWRKSLSSNWRYNC